MRLPAPRWPWPANRPPSRSPTSTPTGSPIWALRTATRTTSPCCSATVRAAFDAPPPHRLQSNGRRRSSRATSTATASPTCLPCHDSGSPTATPRRPGSRCCSRLPPCRRSRADSLLSTRGVITDLAADGNRVAVMTGRLARTCGRVVVFTVPGRRSRSLTPGYLGCHGDGMRAVTLGDGQVAWIEEGGGNDLELTVDAAKI